MDSILVMYAFLQAVNVFLSAIRFNVALAFNAKIGLATRAVGLSVTELVDFGVVAVATMAVLGVLVNVLFGEYSRIEGAPSSLETIDNDMSYLMLSYFTPSTVASWPVEIVQGMPSLGGVWQQLTSAQMFSILLTKFTLPVMTTWLLKKVGFGPAGTIGHAIVLQSIEPLPRRRFLLLKRFVVVVLCAASSFRSSSGPFCTKLALRRRRRSQQRSAASSARYGEGIAASSSGGADE